MKYSVTQVSWTAVGDAIKSAMELENGLCNLFENIVLANF